VERMDDGRRIADAAARGSRAAALGVSIELLGALI